MKSHHTSNKKLVEAILKSSTILKELNQLKNKKNKKLIDNVGIFLIESQWAEWGAKQLLSLLDLELSAGNKKIDYHRYKRIKKMTLGAVIETLKNYSFADKKTGENLSNLIARLNDLKDIRNPYNHHLFASGGVVYEQIIAETEKGVKTCAEIHSLIWQIMKELSPEFANEVKDIGDDIKKFDEKRTS